MLIPSFLSESIELENDRKKNIHAIVTTIMAFAVPLIAFIYALLFQEKDKGKAWLICSSWLSLQFDSKDLAKLAMILIKKVFLKFYITKK